MGSQQIGCPDGYGVTITRQPGNMTTQGIHPRALGSLTDIKGLSYNRIRSAPSSATVSVSGCGPNDDVLRRGNQLINPWAYEIVIHRDSRIAFMGPLLDIFWDRNTESWELTAGDVMTSWSAVREIHPEYTSPVGADAATILTNLLKTYFFDNTDDPDMWRHVMQIGTASVPISLVYKDATFTVGDKLRELVNMGANYAVVGRSILIFGEDPPNFTKPMLLSASDIGGQIRLFKSGRSPFGVHTVGRGEDITKGIGETAPDKAEFGKVSRITQFDGITVQAQLDALTQSWYDTTRVMRHDIDIAAGSVLGQDAILAGDTNIMNSAYALDFLVPGYRYDVAISKPDFPIKGSFPMRLDELSVSWSREEGERVGVSFVTLGLEH